MDRRRARAARAASTSRSSETGGHPIVYADWLHADGAPTVLVYCHYDVQPVDPLDLWEIAAVRALHPRRPGASAAASADDKGQIRPPPPGRRGPPRDARAAAGEPQVSCSRARRSRARRASRPLARGQPRPAPADAAIISDTGFFEGNLPAITLGLRGMVYAQIDVVGPVGRPPLRRLRRRRREPGQRPGPDHRGAQGPGRPGPRPGLLRRRRCR